MLKRSILSMVIVIGLITLSSPVKAELYVIGPNLIFETTGDQFWFQDLSFFINQNYDQQIESIDALGDHWRMANEEDIDNLWVYSSIEIGESFLPSYIVGTFSTGWRGRANYILSDNPVYGIFHATPNIWKENDTWHNKIIFGTPADTATQFLGAWVVTDVCPLPPLELTDSLYENIEQSEINDRIKNRYLRILDRVTILVQKDRTDIALYKIDTLANKIQGHIDNGRINSQVGEYWITMLDILSNKLSPAV